MRVPGCSVLWATGRRTNTARRSEVSSRTRSAGGKSAWVMAGEKRATLAQADGPAQAATVGSAAEVLLRRPSRVRRAAQTRSRATQGPRPQLCILGSSSGLQRRADPPQAHQPQEPLQHRRLLSDCFLRLLSGPPASDPRSTSWWAARSRWRHSRQATPPRRPVPPRAARRPGRGGRAAERRERRGASAVTDAGDPRWRLVEGRVCWGCW